MRKFILTVDADNATLAPYVEPVPPVVTPPVVVSPPAPARVFPYAGCNLTGGGTAYTDWSQATGPVEGQHYKFVPTSDVDQLIAAGMNTFRVLFTWEAVQTILGATVGGGGGNYSTYWTKLRTLVDYIVGKGCHVILDIHGEVESSFAGYRGKTVAQDGAVAAGLANLWGQLTTAFSFSPNVHYGITNEPHDMAAATWYGVAQRVINTIRVSGGKGIIFMPGVDWTGAGTWMDHNAAAWNLVDPLNNLQVQAHLYFDDNAGGGDSSIANSTIGSSRMANLVKWARGKGLKVFLGEVGIAASNSLAQSAWGNLMFLMQSNPDVCSGFCFWACGPKDWWGGYQFYCGPGSKQLDLIKPVLK